MLVVQACHRSDAVTARLEVLSDELEFVPSLVDGTDHSVHNGSRHARSDGDPARQGLQTGQLTLLGLTAASDQPLSRRKGPHGPDGSHGVGEQLAAVPRSELTEPCGTPAEVVQHHGVFHKGWRPGSLLEEAPTRGPISCEPLVRCRFAGLVGRWSLVTLFFHLGWDTCAGRSFGQTVVFGTIVRFLRAVDQGGSKLDPSSHAASRLCDMVTTEIRDSPSDPAGLEDGSSDMSPSPTFVILRRVCDVGVTSPSLLLSLDSLRLGLRGRRRRRFSDPDDSGELPREDGVGVRGPDLSGAPFPAGPSSVLTGIASSTGPQSPESSREATGPGPLLPSIASFHTHTADVAQACRNFTLGLFALPPPHSTPARTMH